MSVKRRRIPAKKKMRQGNASFHIVVAGESLTQTGVREMRVWLITCTSGVTGAAVGCPQLSEACSGIVRATDRLVRYDILNKLW